MTIISGYWDDNTIWLFGWKIISGSLDDNIIWVLGWQKYLANCGKLRGEYGLNKPHWLTHWPLWDLEELLVLKMNPLLAHSSSHFAVQFFVWNSLFWGSLNSFIIWYVLHINYSTTFSPPGWWDEGFICLFGWQEEHSYVVK